jgi:hypothetical protein
MLFICMYQIYNEFINVIDYTNIYLKRKEILQKTIVNQYSHLSYATKPEINQKIYFNF